MRPAEFLNWDWSEKLPDLYVLSRLLQDTLSHSVRHCDAAKKSVTANPTDVSGRVATREVRHCLAFRYVIYRPCPGRAR
jgi:hypothetical protein